MKRRRRRIGRRHPDLLPQTEMLLQMVGRLAQYVQQCSFGIRLAVES